VVAVPEPTRGDVLTRAKRQAREMAAQEAAALFCALLRRDGLPTPEREWQFCPDRKWRMDFAFPIAKLGIEVDGGIWTAGRHTRGAGWLKDTEKLNTAASMGWRMLRTTPDGLTDLAFIALIKRTLSPHDP
jgi:very-short-patch-repair endonuclease